MHVHAILVFLFAFITSIAAEWNNEFFTRSLKWIPSGGAGLVSGRGNFRPGFTGRGWSSILAEPSFGKRNVNDKWYSEENR
ncbi:hypothetical protein KIN20_002000 [Parelaphostrongylus tenuis]|uniref:Uncharacterized protein n=1 Tax=Parelaphostrongylus tenuis TaxID=148309 RepID=A0AAD5QCQ6_PARTN|nr:hypothetical protein KIN20_002000 [Parelaphostrongylus tenuis]